MPEATKGINLPESQPAFFSQIGLSAKNAINEGTEEWSSGVDHVVGKIMENESKMLPIRRKVRDLVLKNIVPKIPEIVRALDSMFPFSPFRKSHEVYSKTSNYLSKEPEPAGEDTFYEPDLSRVDINMKQFKEPSPVRHSMIKYNKGKDGVVGSETDSLLEALDMLSKEPKTLKTNKWNLMVE